MKTLFLVRHAKAETSREPELQDSERSLAKKGKKSAQKLARTLRKNSPAPQLIISSPAKRALKTAQILAAELDYPAEAIVLNETLYRQPEEGGEAALLEMIRTIDNQYKSVMIVGHDPLLSKFARFLYRDFAENLPAGAVAELEFAIRSWNRVKAGAAALKTFDFPGRKKQLRKDRQSDLQAKIETAIRRAAGKVQPESAEAAADSIRKVSRKLARNLVKDLETPKKAPQTGEEIPPQKAAAPEWKAAPEAPVEKKTVRRRRSKTAASPAAPKKTAKPRKAATRKRAAAPQKTASPKKITAAKRAAAPQKTASPKKITAAKRAAAPKKTASPKKITATKPAAAPKKAASSKKITAAKRAAAPKERVSAPKKAAAPKRAAAPGRSKSAAKPKKAARPQGTRRKRESKNAQ